MFSKSFTLPFHLKPESNDRIHLVQLTDCHLFADAGTRLQDMNTRQSFDAICRLIENLEQRPDLLLATGDLTQDSSAAGYRYLAQAFEGLDIPAFWIPGNHDDVPTMLSNLTGNCIHEARQIIAGAWQIVLLDSTLPGQTPGEVSLEQLDFLEQCLVNHPERYALIGLHHQALPAGSDWIDAKGLQNQDELKNRILPFKQVKAVLWGHVHQASERQIENITWMSTPSTCVQFKPASKEFATDDLPPGIRILEMSSSGNIQTRVVRLDSFT